jgi:SAM-dependent methyltransferase
MSFNLRGKLFRIWYWYVNRADKNAEVLFMNYGYSDPLQKIELDSKDEPNRYSIQLYHHLASHVDLKNKDILEIGCGRGGGLSYVTKNFAPAKAMGIDLDERAVTFCNRYYKIPGLNFKQGDAQNLPLDSNSCDVLLNVESSHRYPEMDSFLSEVVRILRPGGYFLLTDFRFDWEMDLMQRELNACGLKLIKEQLITGEVVAALDADDGRRRELIRKIVPRFLHKIALNFAGTVGSETYNHFVSRKYIYFTYIFQKK